MSKLTDNEVRAIVEARARSALGSTEAELTADRENALDAYYGRPMGNEIDGRAQVVTKDLMDVIEWRMPSLMRIFASSQSVQFDPEGPEDTELAKQESQYVSHVLWKKNPGFMIVYNWLKDALQQKVGYVKYWWQDEEKLVFDEYSGMDESQLLQTMQSLEEAGEVDVLASDQDKDGLYSIKVRTKKKYGCAKIEGAPPEEVIVDSGCRGNIKNASFVGHWRRNVKRSDLVEMGYARDRVERLVSYSLSNATQVELSRDTVGESRSDEENSGDWASETLTLLECYTYVDEDDDGIAELRRFLLAGNDTLEDEEAAEIQWESWTPFPVPHRHVGLSEYDRMEDLQRINTALMRGTLDNVYFTMNPRLIYDKNTIDTGSLQINRPGGHVANDGPPGVSAMPIPVNPMAGQILQVIDYVNQTLEKRTGIGRNSMGVDADVLAQSTKGAYMDAKSSANQMTEAIARIFAETGLSSLFSSLHRLLSRHQDFATRMKIGANWVEVNPTEWQERANLTVSVGLGNASKDEIRQNLLMMAQAQEKAAMVPGLIQPKNVYALFRRMQTELGLENEDFISDPAEQQEQQPPQSDPYIEGEKLKAQARMQEKQIDSRDKALDRDQERALKITEMELAAGVDLATAGIGAEVAISRGAQQPGRGSQPVAQQSADPSGLR